MSDSAVSRLVFDASGAKAGADQFKQAGNSVIDTARALEAAQVRIVESSARQGRAVDALARRFDPLGQAVRDAGRDLERLQRIAAGTGENAERAATLIAGAQTKLAAAQSAQTAVQSAHIASSKELEAQTGKTSNAMRQLGIQSIDVFQQLASGAPVMTTFIQQGGQIGQVMAVTNTSVGSVARSIGQFVAQRAGIIATGAALAGVGVAAYLVFQRSSELAAQQRELSVAIAGVGRSADLSAGQLQGYVQRLREQGVASADAAKAVAELARNPSLSSGMIGRIAGLGPDAGAALGVSAQDAMQKMADAARGSVDAIQKLSDAFNLLTPAEEASVRAMIAAGDKAGALESIFSKLEGRVRGLNEQALSPMDKAFRDLGNSWDGFMTRVANSGPVLAVIQQLNRDVQAISGAVFGRTGEALSQEIVGLDRQLAGLRNDSAYDSSPQTTAARRAEITRLEARQAELIARARAESDALRSPAAAAAAVYGPAAPAIPAPNTGIELARTAAERAAGSDVGKIAALTTETNRFRDALKSLDPSVAGNRDLIKTYTDAIKANEKSLEDLRKKGEHHRTGLEKAEDTINAQIKAQRALAEAYRQGPEAIARVLAAQEAEKKAISDGLQPGTAKYLATVTSLTDQYQRLADATAAANLAKVVEETDQATAAQERIAAAYDGTAKSIEVATDRERAYATVLKSGLQPGTVEFAESVERINVAYSRGSDLATQFRQEQQSVAAITDALGTAFDRLGQGIVDAFVSGRGAAVSFGNISRAVMGSLLTDLVKFGAVNPIRNALFGSSYPTLGAAAGVASGGGGGLLGGLGNVLSIGRLSDSLGFTNIGGSISNFLGFGEGGLFSGVGNSISGLLNAPIFGQAAAMQATNSALAGLGAGVVYGPAAPAFYGPAAPASVGVAGTTFGQILGGIGGGFALGSLGGGLLQSALGKTGPGPTIGAGVGAVGGTIIGSLLGGPVLGGILGGLLGGGGGGLIGPGEPNAFSATGLNVGGDGMLSVGRTFSQVVDPSGEVNTLTQQIAQLNAIMSQFGARITNGASRDEFGQSRIIGGRSGQWLNFGQGGGRPGDLTGAFGELRFGSDNAQLNKLLSREFNGLEDLAGALQEAATFLNDMAPALKILGSAEASFGVGSLAKDLETLNQQFDQAVTIAERLGWAEYDLNAAREQAIKTANDNVTRQFNVMDQQFIARRLTAQGAVSNDPALQLSGALIAFDLQADAQRKSFREQLRAAFGDAVEQTEGFAVQMGLLEETLGAERLATAKSYQDAIAATSQPATSAAISVVSSITDYVRGVTFGGESPIPANDRYGLASSQFTNAIASARGGDASALRNITSFAETFRASSRAQFGSGAQYVADTNRIFSALEELAGMAPETLTSAIFASETRTQTQTLVDTLHELKDVLGQIRDEQRRSTNGPPMARAA